MLALVTAVLAEYGLRADLHGTDADLTQIERTYLASGGDFVVLTDSSGAVTGCCGLLPLGDATVDLRRMYLAQPLRGRGHGRRLLDWALARGRELGFRRISLETATVLKEAIALYSRHGFERDETRCQSCRCDLAFARQL